MGTLFQSRDRADVRKPTAEEQDDDRRKKRDRQTDGRRPP